MIRISLKMLISTGTGSCLCPTTDGVGRQAVPAALYKGQIQEDLYQLAHLRTNSALRVSYIIE